MFTFKLLFQRNTNWKHRIISKNKDILRNILIFCHDQNNFLYYHLIFNILLLIYIE